VQCRREAEDDAGRETDRDEEPEDGRVHRELDPIRLADVGNGAVEEPNPEDGERQAQRAAKEGQQDAFHEQLPDDAGAAGPERDANGHFARAVGGSGEQEVGDVGARDEQDEADGTHERQEHHSDRPAVEPLVERHQPGIHPLVGVGVLLLETPGDAGHLGLRLLHADARGEAAEEVESAGIAALQVGVRHERLPHVGVVGKPVSFGHHTDDDAGDFVHPDSAADDRRIPAVPGLPESIAENDDRFGPRLILSGAEVAAEHRAGAENAERVRRHPHAVGALGGVSAVADVHRLRLVRRKRGERARLRLPVAVIGKRDTHVVPRDRVARIEVHDLVGVVERQTAQEDRVDEREHGIVDADAERQGEDRHEGEPAILEEHAHREPEIHNTPRGTASTAPTGPTARHRSTTPLDAGG
jgi:hypothetical protein